MSDCDHEKICNICNPVNMLLIRYQRRNGLLVEENEQLKAENQNLKEEITRQLFLRAGLAYKRQNNAPEHIIECYKKEIEKFNAENEKKNTRRIEEQKEENKELKEQVSDLQSQLMEERRKNVNYHCQLKELRRPKEQCKFKVGDRVVAYTKAFFSKDITKTKGTVEAISESGDTLSIRSENGILVINNFPVKACKKLVRKIPKFKAGDRVSLILSDGNRLKGTVAHADKQGYLWIIAQNHKQYLMPSSQCKRLVKVKKVNCVRCFLSGIFGIFPTPNCKTCNGAGVVKEKCSQ